MVVVECESSLPLLAEQSWEGERADDVLVCHWRTGQDSQSTKEELLKRKESGSLLALQQTWIFQLLACSGSSPSRS